jgi:hypothetical protein
LDKNKLKEERETAFVMVGFRDILLAIARPLCSRSLEVSIATKACITKSSKKLKDFLGAKWRYFYREGIFHSKEGS